MNFRNSFAFIIFILIIFNGLPLKAEVFTVISKANSGPGTLNEAITKANANGTGEMDYIYFNLPGSTAADVTIQVTGVGLPALSSNIIIDGSTQPSAALSPNGAKVAIIMIGVSQYTAYYGLHVQNAENVAIYGMMISLSLGNGYGILLNNTTGVTIGAPGKGNVIMSLKDGYGISTWGGGGSRNIKIQSNIIGLDESGTGYTLARSVWDGIKLPVRNALIGGDTPAEGNVIYGHSQSIILYPNGGDVRISNNKIGTDITGTKSFHFSQLAKVHIEGAKSDPPNEVIVTDNLISGGSWWGLQLMTLPNGFKVQRNKINTEITGQHILTGSYSGIVVRDCAKGLIGGSVANENIIAGSGAGPGVTLSGSFDITISQNKMFCNRSSGIGLGWANAPAGRPEPLINITKCDGTSMSGNTLPNAKVEVFLPYRCTDYNQCDGKDYIETIYADADGNFTYPLNGRNGVIFTATDQFGATGPYTAPFVNISTGDIVHTTCGKSTGKIIVKELRNAAPFQWENEAGDIVGTDMSLINVPAGKYRLIMFGAGCKTKECITTSEYYEIKDISPAINRTVVSIQDAACGRRDGSISNLYFSGNNQQYSWRNEAGVEIGNEKELRRVPPGNYYLTLTDAVDKCAVTEGPFKVGNSSGGATLDLSAVVITDAICGKTTGSIKGVKVNGLGNITHTWKNEQGVVQGNTPDIANLPPGKYYLYYNDFSTCYEVKSDAFEIRSISAITIDKSKVSITPAGCNSSTGSILNLEITGGDNWTWKNESGNIAAVIDAPAGVYTLTINNAAGCSLTEKFTIPQAAPTPITVQQTTRHPSCDLSNGSITINSFTGGTPISYKWMNSAGMVISTQKDLLDVGEGVYRLFVTDKNNCEQLVGSTTLENIPRPLPPVVDDVQIVKGMIAVIKVKQPERNTMHLLYGMNISTPIANSASGEFSIQGLVKATTFMVAKQKEDCISSPTPVKVDVVEAITTIAPTAFSPNGDGKNDVFRVKAFGLASLELFTVHDRWGNRIFITKDINAVWDGTYNQQKVPAGTYVWTLKGKDIKGAVMLKQSFVVVVY